MENQEDNQIQNDNQNQILYTVKITKNYKKETNKEEGIDINATLVFAVPVEDHNEFFQEEDIQKEVVLVSYCKYQNKDHQYIVDDKINAGSFQEKCKNQKIDFELSEEDDFPFEKLLYFLDKKTLTLEDNQLELNISIKLIATKLASSFENRFFKEYYLKTITFDQEAEKYIKQKIVDCTEHLQQILQFDREIQFPINYPEKFRDKLNLQFTINQIIQQNQSVSIKQFKLRGSNLNIQNIYAYTCYQLKIKSKYFAQPLKIFSKKQLQNSEDVVELSIQNVSQVPFIYKSDKITCKHFLIINLQYKKFFQTKGIDILIPLVIIDPQKTHSYYISKNKIDKYFEMKMSFSMVTFSLYQHIPPNENIKSLENRTDEENQLSQDNIRPHYKQLLNSVDN